MKVNIGAYNDNGKKRQIEVHIDNWDTWSMDHTLSYIIVPMLKQLKKTTHGSAIVDQEDLPEHLKGTTTEDWDDQRTFEFYQQGTKLRNADKLVHERWKWVLKEMIWAFKQIRNNMKKDDKFFDKNHNLVDKDGYEAYHKRVDNGTRLFGKYYRGLWD